MDGSASLLTGVGFVASIVAFFATALTVPIVWSGQRRGVLGSSSRQSWVTVAVFWLVLVVGSLRNLVSLILALVPFSVAVVGAWRTKD
jgi:hypothetical protein